MYSSLHVVQPSRVEVTQGLPGEENVRRVKRSRRGPGVRAAPNCNSAWTWRQCNRHAVIAGQAAVVRRRRAHENRMRNGDLFLPRVHNFVAKNPTSITSTSNSHDLANLLYRHFVLAHKVSGRASLVMAGAWKLPCRKLIALRPAVMQGRVGNALRLDQRLDRI